MNQFSRTRREVSSLVVMQKITYLRMKRVTCIKNNRSTKLLEDSASFKLRIKPNTISSTTNRVLNKLTQSISNGKGNLPSFNKELEALNFPNTSTSQTMYIHPSYPEGLEQIKISHNSFNNISRRDMMGY